MKHATPRALVVEDDRSWQQLLAEILHDAGLAVDITDNLEDAREFLRTVPHRIAVVDLSLKGLGISNQDGLTVLSETRRLDPECTTVLLTGFATVEIAVSALAEHGALYSTDKRPHRPIAPETLIGCNIAMGRNDNLLDLELVPDLAQPITDPVRLPQCQITSARART